MKIRTGFVANSSSTAFFMIFNGGKEQLLSLIDKYGSHFDLEYELYNNHICKCCFLDVYTAIDKCFENGSIKVKKLEELLDDNRASLKRIEKYSAEEKIKNRVTHMNDFYTEYLVETKKEIKQIDNLIKKGFKNYIEIDFGDNHGEIHGGDLGNVMDYAGRDISIKEDDFFIYTKQNR